MQPKARKHVLAVVFVSLAVLLIAIPAFSQAANAGRTFPAPQVLGAEDPARQISVTFWLKQHDKATFDEMVRQMYDRNSTNYHHWLTIKEYQNRFAPSAADMAVVKQHLAANHLSVVNVDKLNHAVTARGTVADVERATGVQLNRVLINGEAHRLPNKETAIAGDAGKLVYAVQGLADFKYKSHAVRPRDPDTGTVMSMTPISKLTSKVGPAQQYFNANCLRARQVRNFRTNGTTPNAVYQGARYGGPITAGPPNLPSCGYDATQVEKAYGLTSLYKQNLDGNGQTMVIVDAFGSDSITDDSNIFAEINGLPALTSSNFAIYYPTGPTDCGAASGNPNTCGWDLETSLDVQWSHSVAPGANIALVLAADNSDSNLDLSVLWAIDNLVGPVISNSYGIEEDILAVYYPSELVVENNINETWCCPRHFGQFLHWRRWRLQLRLSDTDRFHARFFSLCYWRRRHQPVPQWRPLHQDADRLGKQLHAHRQLRSQSARNSASEFRFYRWRGWRNQRSLGEAQLPEFVARKLASLS